MAKQRRDHLSKKDFLRTIALRVGVPEPLRKAASLRMIRGDPDVRQGVRAGGVLSAAMDDVVRGVDGGLGSGDWRTSPALFSWANRRRDIVTRTRSSTGYLCLGLYLFAQSRAS